MSRHSCKQAAILLTQSVDGSLGWFGRLRLSLHLRSCSKCPQIHKQLLFLREAARKSDHSTETAPPTPDLQERIKAALREQD